uniref:Uncharacterized protein n=1 Tax=Eutreptiella gymnastica TaxID=73025 RepID=A0A7S4FTK1_9EUGL
MVHLRCQIPHGLHMTLCTIVAHILFIEIVYLGRAQETPPACYTLDTGNDGFGAQFHRAMAAYAYAVHHRSNYCFRGFPEMDALTSTNNSKQPEEQLRMHQRITGFQVGDCSGCRFIPQMYEEIEAGRARVYTHQVLKTLRLKYHAAAAREGILYPSYFRPGRTNVAVHYRLGWDAPSGTARTLDIPIVLRTIEWIKVRWPDANIHLFSMDVRRGFEALVRAGAQLHINEDLSLSFHAFVAADVLVLSPSDFSYAAGILQEGHVLYFPMWFNPLPHWNWNVVYTSLNMMNDCRICDLYKVPNSSAFRHTHHYIELERGLCNGTTAARICAPSGCRCCAGTQCAPFTKHAPPQP